MCLAVEAMPSTSSGTSFVSKLYVSAVDSVEEDNNDCKREYSPDSPSRRLMMRSRLLHRLMYASALLRTPVRTVSKRSGRVSGRLSSRVGERGLPVNSSCVFIEAALRQPDSSWVY